MAGRRLSETLGRIQFVLWVVGFTLTFLPQYQLGLLGIPRRIADYPETENWADLNLLSTVGAVMLGLGTIPFLVAVASALRRPADQPPDPWGGATLEWWTDSPPPPGNFRDLPPIRSARPVFEANHPAATEAGR
jgi:heme/copper-type cytochrome/quinol oxidase subunit 1